MGRSSPCNLKEHSDFLVIQSLNMKLLFLVCGILAVAASIESSEAEESSTTPASKISCYSCDSDEYPWCFEKEDLENAGDQAKENCGDGAINCVYLYRKTD